MLGTSAFSTRMEFSVTTPCLSGRANPAVRIHLPADSYFRRIPLVNDCESMRIAVRAFHSSIARPIDISVYASRDKHYCDFGFASTEP